MMNINGTRWLASLALLVSLGCKNGPEPISVEEYGVEGGRWLCRRLFECCDADSRAPLFGAASPTPTTVEECIAYYETVLTPVYAAVARSIDEGRVDYDGSLAASCLEGFAAQSCEEFRASATGSVLAAQCNGVMEGHVPGGGACSTLFDCESRSCTAINPDELGTCRPVVGEGDECGVLSGVAAVCAPGFYCDALVEDPECRRSREDGAECESPLQCASFSCVDNVCGARPPLCEPS